jgi:hypothetical protein
MPFIPLPVNITQNGATLISSAAYGNQWYEVALGLLNGATSQTYLPTQNGNYYAVVTDYNGCVVNSDTLQYLSTGIEANALSDNVKIYPNPTTGMINIELNRVGSNCNVIITNIIGASIYETTLENPDGTIKTIDLSKYPNGIYFVGLKTQQSELRTKVIINK